MEAITIPVIILTFLAHLGCEPTREVYRVDGITDSAGTSLLGVYDPIERKVYIRKDVVDEGVLVHELYHSCQPKAEWGSPQSRLNEREAKGVENAWRDR